LIIKLAEYNQSEEILWRLNDKSSLQNSWQYAQIPIRTNDEFRVFIDAYSGSSDKEFIGIDDITFKTPFVCNFLPSTASPSFSTTESSTFTTPTTQPSIAEFDCDFETSNCAWFNNPNNTLVNWKVVKASSISNEYSPLTDHTLINDNNQFGSYLTLSAASSSKTKVLFSSPLMNCTKCVAFWYYMYGTEVNSLIFSHLFVLFDIISSAF